MSEAFGSSAEADDRGDAAREEERPQSREANIGGSALAHKRELGTAAMRLMQIAERSLDPREGAGAAGFQIVLAKKEAPSEDGAQ
jgi:hypothetical protein